MFRRLSGTEDLWPGEMASFTAAGIRVLLVNVDGTIHAYEDRCQHRAVPLSGGRFQAGILTCPAHEWTYDAATGRGVNPAGTALRRLPVRVDGEGIWVDPEASATDPPRPGAGP